MPFNLIKRYNALLEIDHLSERERKISLRAVFDRDISDNLHFKFRRKIIRPLKKEGEVDMDTLFDHLTCCSEEHFDKKNKKYSSRTQFDPNRSKRLHWIWHHIQERSPDKIEVFSFTDRKNGRDVIRTYIYDKQERYVIILEPHRSGTDYYLLTAYYLTEDKGGIKQIERKRRKRLPNVF